MMILLLALGCGQTNQDETMDFAWSGGDFDFTTTSADDSCLDGALEALFMPDGATTPNAFEFPIYLPSFAELPLSYEIDLREPFVGMPVTVDAADGAMLSGDGVIESVALGAVAYGDCVVTMSAEIDMLPSSADTAEGEARIAISEPRGDDDRCPIYDADPCMVQLTLTASRSQ